MDDVDSLIGIENGLFVNKEVGRRGTHQIKEEDQLRVRHFLHILNKKGKEWHQAHAGTEHHCSDQIICLAVELRQGNKFAFVLLGYGLVHAVDQHQADSELGKRQEIQYIGEKALGS